MGASLLTTDSSIQGKLISSQGTCSIVKMPELGYGFSVSSSTKLGIATGNIYTYDNVNYYEFNIASAYANGMYGVPTTDPVSFSGVLSIPGKDTLQSLINDTLEDHKYTLQNLAVASLVLSVHESAGNTTTPDGKHSISEAKQEIANLYFQLKARENTMKNENLIQGATTGYDSGAASAGFNSLSNIVNKYDYKENFSYVSGIGAVPVVAYIIISALVGAALALIIYYKIKEVKAAAQYDLALSNDFMKWFNKLDSGSQTVVMNQLKATGDNAYKTALSASKGTNFLSNLKTVGIIAASVLGVMYIKGELDIQGVRKQFEKKR